MNSSDQNDKTRIVTDSFDSNDNQHLNDTPTANEAKSPENSKKEKSSGVSKGAFAAAVGAAGIGGVAAGTVFSDDIKGVFNSEEQSATAANDSEHVDAVLTTSDNSNTSELIEPNQELQDGQTENAEVADLAFTDNDGFYEVLLNDINGDGTTDSMTIEAEMVDGSHISFSASGTALNDLMQDNDFELAQSTDYIEAASTGDFEGFDGECLGATGYEIQSGDTLSEIAQANGTSVAHIMELNPGIEDPNVIFAGDEILIPQNDVVSGPYDGWRPEWSDSSNDSIEISEEAYDFTDDGSYSDSIDSEIYESDVESYESDSELYDSNSENYDSVDWESFEDEPVDDYSSYLDQEDFANYDSPDSYYDSGQIEGFEFL